MNAFCEQVGKLVKDQYGYDDGRDLCWSLIEMGVVDMSRGEQYAARIVAQHLEQA